METYIGFFKDTSGKVTRFNNISSPDPESAIYRLLHKSGYSSLLKQPRIMKSEEGYSPTAAGEGLSFTYFNRTWSVYPLPKR